MSELTMPFGKHKGTPFSQLETNYLEWGATNLTFREEKYKNALLAELERRSRGGQPEKPRQQPPPRYSDKGYTREEVRMAFRSMRNTAERHPEYGPDEKKAAIWALAGALELLEDTGVPSQARPAPTDDGMAVQHLPAREPGEDDPDADIPF